MHRLYSKNADRDTLRILILSTPKTGNTWLSRLLSAVYDLPQAGLVLPFDPMQARGLGHRWILFHHLHPAPEIQEWIEETKPVLFTAVRHPADVLVSLYYHLREFQAGGIDPAAVRAMLQSPFDRRDIACSATGSFQDDLECSLEWVRSGRAHVVRYEDLWRDVRSELLRVTRLIASETGITVPDQKIDVAIERGDFSLMRRLAGEHGGFFRSGTVGKWPEVLPDEIREELLHAPYNLIVKELGYSMDPADPIMAAPKVRAPSRNPFRTAAIRKGSALDESIEEEARFENGVPVVPFVVDLYLALSLKHNWKGDPSSVGEGSFFRWLNEPCSVPGTDSYIQIKITNLAFYLYEWRPDLYAEFPDLAGTKRPLYADWFVRGGAQELLLDGCFIEPVRQSLIEWGCARSPDDRETWSWWPKLPNFAMHLYRRRPDLQAAYPDILVFDRWSYLEWIVDHQQASNINPDFVAPVAASLKRLAKLRSVGRYLPGARMRAAASK